MKYNIDEIDECIELLNKSLTSDIYDVSHILMARDRLKFEIKLELKKQELKQSKFMKEVFK